MSLIVFMQGTGRTPVKEKEIQTHIKLHKIHSYIASETNIILLFAATESLNK